MVVVVKHKYDKNNSKLVSIWLIISNLLCSISIRECEGSFGESGRSVVL
jgi:hypothetical protein